MDALRDSRALLLLDNAEHVVAAAPLLAELRAACPRLTMLVTSRTVLRVGGETEYAVVPLALPAPDQAHDLAALSRCAAVQLFVERARAVAPRFALTAANAATVARICVRVEGLPLALELAAARLTVLTPETLLDRMEHVSPSDAVHPDRARPLAPLLWALAGGARDLPARQRTMRATLAWSDALLDAPDRTLLARLAVCAGGCTLEAAEGVCGTAAAVVGDMRTLREDDVPSGLAALVGCNLLRRGERDGEARFTLPEVVREYGLERLVERGELASTRRRHAAYYLEFAEAASFHLGASCHAAWAARLEREHDNLRAALEWTVESGDERTGLRLGGALWPFWMLCGHTTEGRRWLERLLTAFALGATDSAAYAHVLHGVGVLAAIQDDRGHAYAWLDASVRVPRAAGASVAMTG